MPLNEEKIAKCHDDLLKVFQKHNLTAPEIVITYGNLGYSLGASIEGYTGVGPSAPEVTKMYYSDPGRVGIALMAQGILVTTWYDSDKQEQQTEEK